MIATSTFPLRLLSNCSWCAIVLNHPVIFGESASSALNFFGQIKSYRPPYMARLADPSVDYHVVLGLIQTFAMSLLNKKKQIHVYYTCVLSRMQAASQCHWFPILFFKRFGYYVSARSEREVTRRHCWTSSPYNNETLLISSTVFPVLSELYITTSTLRSTSILLGRVKPHVPPITSQSKR